MEQTMESIRSMGEFQTAYRWKLGFPEFPTPDSDLLNTTCIRVTVNEVLKIVVIDFAELVNASVTKMLRRMISEDAERITLKLTRLDKADNEGLVTFWRGGTVVSHECVYDNAAPVMTPKLIMRFESFDDG